MINITITGLNETIAAFKRLGKMDYIKEIMSWAADNAANRARANCPVDTGELLDSIWSNSDDTSCAIGATAPYAVFNEFGSYCTPIGSVESPIPAKYSGYRPFLRPAMIDTTNDLPEKITRKMYQIFNET